jgi:hypothetical protein
MGFCENTLLLAIFLLSVPSSDYTHAAGRGDRGGEDALQQSLLKLERSDCEKSILKYRTVQ